MTINAMTDARNEVIQDDQRGEYIFPVEVWSPIMFIIIKFKASNNYGQMI